MTNVFALSGSWYLVTLGAVAVTAMLVAPRGIWPFIRDRFGIEWLSISRKLADAATPAGAATITPEAAHKSETNMTKGSAMDATTHRQDAVQYAGDRMPVAYDRAPTFSGMIAEKDVAVPMRDGVNLSVDIYRPDGGGKFPALLAFAIYNKDLQGPDVANALPPQPAWSSLWAGPLEAGDTKFFVSRGYVHIIGSPRGVGKSDSGGSRQWDSYDLIEWIAQQPWCDGNVGMVGISGFGAEQLFVASKIRRI